MTFEIYTLGCKVNLYETDEIREQMIEAGFAPVRNGETPDVAIVNSCTVTSTADSKSRQAVRRFKREGAIVVLTGCVPQAYPQQALALTEADIVAGNKSNNLIAEAVRDFLLHAKRVVLTSRHEPNELFRPCCVTKYTDKTRATIKIQDGCNRRCAYCAIPFARGHSRSKSLENLRQELAEIAGTGHKEIVLAGINLSSYGRDLGLTIADAVAAACSVDGIERIRLGSLEPDHITDSLLRELKSAGGNKLCPHFHVSLQSGSDSTLRRMFRPYTCEEYERLCLSLRLTFDGCALTTDVMTGFPGETPEEFEESCRFVERIRFEKLHVFPFSPREGTRAFEMDGLPPKAVREERCRRMIAIGEKIRSQYFDSCIGKEQRVLFESDSGDGYIYGYSDNYTPVKAKAPLSLCGALKNCEIIGVGDNCCIGRLIP